MAEETIKKIIDVHVEGTESLNDLIKQVDDLSKRLQELDKSSQEYKDILAILAKQQAKISASMRGQKQSTEALEGSYDALSRQMRDLRKEWKATNDEQKRSDLGKEINEINTQLKGMDATIGNFQRNVGNYEGALKNVFKSPKQQIKELRDELAQLTEGTDEYNQKLRELAQLTGDQARLNEQLKYSSADIGDVIGNVAGVAQGIAGGLSALQGIAALFGDDDHFGETIKNLTALIAIVQGLGALEGLQDKLKGLKDAWKGFRETAEGTSGVMLGAGDVMKAVSGNAQGTSGALNRVVTNMDGVTASVEQGTQALREQEAELAEYKNRLMEAAAQYDAYIKAHKRGSPAADSAEYRTAQENLALLGDEYKRITITIAQLEERLGMLKRKMAEPGADTKALNDQIKFYEKQISGAKQQQQAIIKENAERKKLNATEREGSKVQAQANAATKESVSLMQLATGWIDRMIAKQTGLTTATRAGSAANSMFILSLKGLKAAITATGIGALVVIMGELINLLFKGVDALKGWISGTDKWNRKAGELADSLERVNSLLDDMNRATDFQTRVMEAQGKSYDEIYQQKRRNLELQLKELEALMLTSEAYQKYQTLTDKQKTKGKYEKVVEEAEKLQAAWDDVRRKLKELDEDKIIHDIEEETRKAGEEAEKAGEKAKEAGDKAAKAAENAKRKIEELRKQLQKTAEDFEKYMRNLSQSKENPYEKLEREYQERMKMADEAQRAETKLAEMDFAERITSREEYERKVSEINERYSKHRLQLAVDEADQYRKLVGQDVYSRTERETKESQTEFDMSEETRKAQEEIEAFKADIENAKPISLWDILFKNDEPKFKDRLQQMKDSYDKTIEDMNDSHQRRLEQLRSTMSRWQEVATSEDIDDETRAKAQDKVRETQNAINDEVTKNLRDNVTQRAAMLKEEEEMWEEHAQRVVSYTQEMAGAVGGIMGSLADIYEQDAENRADGDEKSQKVAKRSFKKAQALRVAEATINTITGALGAFMQANSTYPAPYGQILGAATSAAVLASGMAQIQKIKSQTFDGSSSLSGGGITYQLPSIERYEPSYSQNITGESDTDKLQKAIANGMKSTNIVVRVSDINEAQKTVRVRDNESTW